MTEINEHSLSKAQKNVIRLQQEFERYLYQVTHKQLSLKLWSMMHCLRYSKDTFAKTAAEQTDTETALNLNEVNLLLQALI